MGMQIGGGGSSSEPEVMTELNMTPLIDVMLVLIIMFIITIPIQNHSINLNLPTGPSSPPTTEPVVINIDVDFDGTV
ncbi:ExbD/TolR family protein, partial [Undibacterium luofuense]